MASQWIRFLSSHGKDGKDVLSGKSAKEIRVMYYETLGFGPRVCEWIQKEPIRGQSARWGVIISEIVAKGILALNFDVEDITPFRLSTVAKIINAHMYNGNLDIDKVDIQVAES